MTVITPPGFLQNAGATHTAEMFRNWLGMGYTGLNTGLIPRGGVHPALGNKLQVTQTGSPSMAVLVKSGHCMIPGSEGSIQGAYSAMNDADVTLSISAAHATLNRIDSVVFKVEDSAYSGGVNQASLVVVTGTPASSPSAPTLPANSLELAQVSIVALDTSITNGEITDKRNYLAGIGGVIFCTSTTRPASGNIIESQLIYETDTDKIQAWDGAAWNEVWNKTWTQAWTSFTTAWTGSVSNPVIGNGTIAGAYIKIGRTLAFRIDITMGTTTTFGSGNYSFSLPASLLTVATGVGAGACVTRDQSAATHKVGIPRFNASLNTFDVRLHGENLLNATTFAWASTDSISVGGVVDVTT